MGHVAGRPRDGLPTSDKERLVQALGDVPVLRDPGQRQLVIDELRKKYQRRFDPTYYGSTNADLWALVESCMEIDAMPVLLDVAKAIGGEVEPWRRLKELVEERGTQFSWSGGNADNSHS